MLPDASSTRATCDDTTGTSRNYTHSADGRRSDAVTKIATAICGPTAPAEGAAAEGV